MVTEGHHVLREVPGASCFERFDEGRSVYWFMIHEGKVSSGAKRRSRSRLAHAVLSGAPFNFSWPFAIEDAGRSVRGGGSAPVSR